MKRLRVLLMILGVAAAAVFGPACDSDVTPVDTVTPADAAPVDTTTPVDTATPEDTTTPIDTAPASDTIDTTITDPDTQLGPDTTQRDTEFGPDTTQPDTITPECSGSATRCSGANAQACSAGSWVTVAFCEGSTTCQNGVCVPTAACTNGTRRCSGSALQLCSAGQWTTEQTCINGCSNDQCKPNPVYVVLFTHIEDNKPAGVLGSVESRVSYLKLRSDLINMGEAARRNGVAWTLQADWKFLEAARLFEDASTMASTGGRNILRYLRDSLGAVIDPHSHESTVYNYTDVAYLLDQLGVGGSTVVGGHIWDPSLPQFAEWDRFRVPVAGRKYPQASWRGDILMGAATPNHVNDPTVSSVWRPRNRGSYFTDDPTGNIVNIGGYKGDIDGVSELWNLGKAGTIASSCILTSTYHITTANFATPGNLAAVERDVIAPLVSLRVSGHVMLTDFTSLVSTWRNQYSATGCVYQQ